MINVVILVILLLLLLLLLLVLPLLLLLLLLLQLQILVKAEGQVISQQLFTLRLILILRRSVILSLSERGNSLQTSIQLKQEVFVTIIYVVG